MARFLEINNLSKLNHKEKEINRPKTNNGDWVSNQKPPNKIKRPGPDCI